MTFFKSIFLTVKFVFLNSQTLNRTLKNICYISCYFKNSQYITFLVLSLANETEHVSNFSDDNVRHFIKSKSGN